MHKQNSKRDDQARELYASAADLPTWCPHEPVGIDPYRVTKLDGFLYSGSMALIMSHAILTVNRSVEIA